MKTMIMKTMILPTALALGAALLSAHPAQAQNDQFFVAIDGARQGMFHGGSVQKNHAGDIVGLKYNYSATVATTTGGGGGGAGKLQHSSVTFEKEWDTSTTQIYQALVTNERLNTVIFEFDDVNAVGGRTAFRIKLTNATIVGVHQHVGDTRYDSTLDTRRYEDISLNFQTILIEHLPTGGAAGATVGDQARRAPATRRGTSPVQPPRLTARAR